MSRSKLSTLLAIGRGLCPRCRTGKIFRGSVWWFPAMHETCMVCGLKFDREPGYFLGALYVGYGLGIIAVAVLSVLVWRMLGWPLVKSVVAGMVLFVPLTPLLASLARVLWIYMDQAIDPERS